MASQRTVERTLRNAKGNVAQDMKDTLVKFYEHQEDKNHFIYDIMGMLEATEINIFSLPDEPNKKQVRIVFEMDVTLGQSTPGLTTWTRRGPRSMSLPRDV